MIRTAASAATAFALSLALAAGAARAQGKDLSCRNGAFPAENAAFGLARLKGPLRLFDDADGCPDAGARCATSDRLAIGAAVITGREHGAFVCVLQPNGKGGSAGWAPRDRLAQRPAPARPPLSAWRGWWRAGSEVILLDPQRDGAVRVSGRATWQGLSTQHFGQINAVARPDGARLVAREADGGTGESCQATLHLLGPYLIAADNNRCGGANVSFTGVYSRFTPKAKRRPPR